ncbi:MAG TPA: hypothetical protein VF068_02510 [Rubrobacter sp.]
MMIRVFDLKIWVALLVAAIAVAMMMAEVTRPARAPSLAKTAT